ncbi:hypothetical protein BH10CHL1_BH10CHL1_46520 [soil metagenome]
MTYPHMTVLFWLYVGLAVATMSLPKTTIDFDS